MRLPSWLAQHLAALRALIVFTVLLGLVYPLLITAAARIPGLSDRADGSLVAHDGGVVGSRLIGQSFAGLPRYFQSRPSAAGDGYDPTATSASNLGPENMRLLDLVCARSKAVGEFEGVDGSRPYCTADGAGTTVRGNAPSSPVVPADAVTASGSGLDPHISVAYANLQIRRVAAARGRSAADVRKLVERNTTGRTLGFIGEPAVNVLELNLALDRG